MASKFDVITDTPVGQWALAVEMHNMGEQSRLTTMLLQRGRYARAHATCPYCGRWPIKREEIVDLGYRGLYCVECKP